MPELSVYLTDDVYELVKKEIEDGQILFGERHNLSAAISSLIKKGSPYILERSVNFRKKREGE